MRTSIAIAFSVSVFAGCAADDEPTFETEAAAAAAPTANPPAPGGVAFARDTSERIYGIHIRDRAHRGAKVVYSVRLDALGADEKLLLRGEVTLSRCNAKDIAGESGDAANTPCDSNAMQDRPYNYTPRFSAAFVLADDANDANGRRVSPWFDRNCTEGQHHCALALPEVAVSDPPTAAAKFVNLVVTADSQSANAKDWHVMEVEQSKGALAVTRVAPNAGGIAITQRSTELLATQAMGIDRPAEDGDPTQVRHLLYQLKLTGLAGGDVISADARMRAILGNGFTCDPLITTEILVTTDRDARDVKSDFDERITIKNGANCADHGSDGCKYEESGAVRLRNNAPSTMFVSFLGVALRSCAAPGGDDKWRVDRGYLDVAVRR